MTVYGVQSITYDPQVSPGAVKTSSNPDQQEMDFLQMLVAQISNQTPDTPMDPTAMITQYSQMEASVALSKLNTSTSTYQNSAIASGLLHQPVTVKVPAMNGDPAAATSTSGTVDGVDFSSDTPQIKVNGTYYPLADVLHVGA